MVALQSRHGKKRWEKQLSSCPENRPYLRGRIFPSGRFSVGKVPKHDETRSDKKLRDKSGDAYEIRTTDTSCYDSDGNKIILKSEKFFYNLTKQCPSRGIPPNPEFYNAQESSDVKPLGDPLVGLTGEDECATRDYGSGESSPHDKTDGTLGLTTLSYCRKRRGLHGLTKRGRLSIREGAYLLKRKYGRRGLGFFTLTCPYSRNEDVHRFSQNLPVIMKRYFEGVKRLYERKGLEFFYVGVIEIQTRRMLKYDSVALHVHYVCNLYADACNKKYACTFEELRSIWHRCIRNVCGADITYKCSVDGKRVTHDPGAYLAKYFSKGGGDIDAAEEVCPGVAPGRWYTLSNNLRGWLKREIVHLTGDKAYEAWSFIVAHRHDREVIYAYYEVTIRMAEGHNYLCGVSGSFNTKCKDDLTEIWRTSSVNMQGITY